MLVLRPLASEAAVRELGYDGALTHFEFRVWVSGLNEGAPGTFVTETVAASI